MITETAKAKVNLTLEIRGRRTDGYHELVSLVVFADVGDTITLEPRAPFAIETEGPFADAIDGENLIEKACRLVREGDRRLVIGKIRLTKTLPVAAGLGGGSADAAAVLRALRRWGMKLTDAALADIAAKLGADVTVCLRQQPALMWGIGEKTAGVPPLPPFWLVLANPGLTLATANVFRALHAAPSQSVLTAPSIPGPFASLAEMTAWARARGNALQATAEQLCPPITHILGALNASTGCLLSAQSGSGPTCFGIFAYEAGARDAAHALETAHPDWWVVAAAVASATPSE